jgi:hypothetical protein
MISLRPHDDVDQCVDVESASSIHVHALLCLRGTFWVVVAASQSSLFELVFASRKLSQQSERPVFQPLLSKKEHALLSSERVFCVGSGGGSVVTHDCWIVVSLSLVIVLNSIDTYFS